MNKPQNILDINLKRTKGTLSDHLDDNKKKTIPLKNIQMQKNLAGRQENQKLIYTWNQTQQQGNKSKQEKQITEQGQNTNQDKLQRKIIG